MAFVDKVLAKGMRVFPGLWLWWSLFHQHENMDKLGQIGPNMVEHNDSWVNGAIPM